MFETKIMFIHFIMTILYIETKGHQIFLSKGIDSILFMPHTKYDI